MTSVDIIASASTTYAAWKTANDALSTGFCPYKVTVTLTANVGTAWATAAIKKISTAIITDSDGYMMGLQATPSSSLAYHAAGHIWEGGCAKTATSNAVCFRTTAVSASAKVINMSATY